MDLDDLTSLEDSTIFKLEKTDTRPFEFYPEAIMAISFEMDLDLRVIERSIENIVDVMSDIGGFNEILSLIGTFFLSIINYQKFDNYLTSKLFKQASPDGE